MSISSISYIISVLQTYAIEKHTVREDSPCNWGFRLNCQRFSITFYDNPEKARQVVFQANDYHCCGGDFLTRR
jgi:hypothetical protein